jgi:hypothetical protein
MDKKTEATPGKGGTPSEAELTAEKVRAARKAKREAKAAAAAAAKAAKKNAIGPQAGGRKNPFGVPGSVSKGHTVSRSIISRARGGRSR